MRRIVAVFVLGLSLLAGGCLYPVAVSPECQSKISECLAQCEGQSDSGEITEATADPKRALTDHRSACESHCHSLCH